MSKRVLIVNDDGYKAKGINLIYSITKEVITDDVWMVAPEVNNSGVSSDIRPGVPFEITQHDDKIFSVNSTPVVCFNAGNDVILADKKPDITISGINNGSNVSSDIRYSGTFGIAMESYVFGIPAIAFSQSIKNELSEEKSDDFAWDVSRYFVPKILPGLVDFVIENNLLISVNLPDCEPQDVKGIVYATQNANLRLTRPVSKLNNDKYRLGNRVILNADVEGTDYVSLKENNIVVTAYSVDWNDVKNMDKTSEFVKQLNLDTMKV